MVFWKYDTDNSFATVGFVEESTSIKNLRKFILDGDIENQWVHTNQEDVKKPISDFPMWLTSFPIMDQKALDVILPYIDESVTVRKLKWAQHLEKQIYLVFVHEVIDCLNIDQSDIVYFSNGRIMNVNNFVLRCDLLKNIHIFRLPQPVHGSLFLSEKLRQVYIENQLIGLTFNRIAKCI